MTTAFDKRLSITERGTALRDFIRFKNGPFFSWQKTVTKIEEPTTYDEFCPVEHAMWK